MQEHLKQEPKSLQKALEQKEQLEARIANERSKYAADLRTAQSRHKHMIGGAVVKYFPGVYHFDEAEVNEIIMAALATRECLKTIKTIERRNQSAESYTDDIIKRVSAMWESIRKSLHSCFAFRTASFLILVCPANVQASVRASSSICLSACRSF